MLGNVSGGVAMNEERDDDTPREDNSGDARRKSLNRPAETGPHSAANAAGECNGRNLHHLSSHSHRAEMLFSRQKEAALQNELDDAASDLQRTQGELRSLTAHLITAQEEERQHIARELHDDVSQRLSLIGITLQQITGIGLRREDLERLRSARRQVETLNNDVRSLSHRLHSSILADLGLPAALKALVEEFGERENMPATFVGQDLPDSWPPIAALSLYRIAQEALRNVAKHAGKTHVKVILSGAGGSLQLRVTDFGVGFDQESEMASRGLGMISMQERAGLAGGVLAVRSALGEGTTVTAEVPLEHHA